MRTRALYWLPLLLTCCLASVQAAPLAGVLTLDAPDAAGLPRRFRTSAFPLVVAPDTPALSRQGLDGLRVSGSSQFSLPQLVVLLRFLPGRVTLVDLRRESHGFLGGAAVSWRLPDNQGNPGQDAAAVAAAEAGLLAGIDAAAGVVVARDKNAGQDGAGGDAAMTLGPLPATTEAAAAAALGLGYFRLAVSDHTRPDVGAVDQFVRLYRALAPDVWLHFHCRGGAGRTTTFLCLADMLQNARDVPFDVILARQKALGGSDLAKIAGGATPGRDALAGARLEFLRQFYAYAQAHPGGQGQTFGAWLAGNGQP